MDRTLVDLLPHVEASWRKCYLLHAIPAENILSICHCVRSEEVLELIAPHLAIKSEIDFIDQFEKGCCKYLKYMPIVTSLILSLDISAWAIVTSAPTIPTIPTIHRLADCNIPCQKILIASDMVKNRKPNPEPYLTAASAIGNASNDYLVFEDALPGIQSALNSGCTVIKF